ncbi:hypothetical protein [Clostridium sp. DL1XJH146]
MIDTEEKLITFLFIGERAERFIYKWEENILEYYNDMYIDDFGRYPVEFLTEKPTDNNEQRREYILIVDLSDNGYEKEIKRLDGINIYSVINIYTEENQKEIKPFVDTNNIYVAHNNPNTLCKMIVEFTKIISPTVHMGDMFESTDFKEVMGNKSFIVENFSKSKNDDEIIFSSVSKLIDKIKPMDNLKKYSTLILLLCVGNDFSVFNHNEIMMEMFNKCEENAEIINCTAILKEMMLPEQVELILLKGN